MKLFLLLTLITSIVHAGPCQCPTDTDKRGYRCGKRSAFCKPGGEEPACGTKTEKERLKLKKLLCS